MHRITWLDASGLSRGILKEKGCLTRIPFLKVVKTKNLHCALYSDESQYSETSGMH